jgi:hypothetical protein
MHPLFFYQGHSLVSLALMLIISAPLAVISFSRPRSIEW